MTREPLERLLETVTDDELESLRDAILREEGRRRVQLELTIEAPFPPLGREQEREESVVLRWAKLITWLAKDENFPVAKGKRGVSLKLLFSEAKPDAKEAGILIQQALVQAGLLMGRTPEWIDATVTEVVQADRDAVIIQMWDKPDSIAWRA